MTVGECIPELIRATKEVSACNSTVKSFILTADSPVECLVRFSSRFPVSATLFAKEIAHASQETFHPVWLCFLAILAGCWFVTSTHAVAQRAQKKCCIVSRIPNGTRPERRA